MVFDYTHGKKAQYLVHIYRWNLNDRMYFHAFKEAKKMYENAITKEWEQETYISLYDMNKDICKARKAF